ncbi:MAG: efflux RND transporter periplasmic adaptor subunit [Gammaproteobacteria bacterium]|nr:efflux RND transporter periplasmic adaptor subunit [Gammaproteobacteria bacterium]
MTIGVLAAIALAAAFLVYATGGRSARLDYSLDYVSRGDIESVVVTTGTLEALNTVIVGSQLSGQIADLHADFNDIVVKNQLIARLDPRTFEARVEQNEANVKVARATILQREADIVRWQATLAQARRELGRREALKEKGHISVSELDQDHTAVETGDAQLRMAEAALANAVAVLEQRRAALSQSQLDLERTYIRSPVSGTVINRTIEQGQTVAASMQAPELFTIAQDLHEMKVEASVDEADIGRVKEGMKCRFSVDAYPDREFRGRIRQIRKAPDVVQNVVTYRVIITANNDDLALLPGMTANVEIVLGSKQNVLQVANAALRFVPKNVTSSNVSASQGADPPGTQRRGRPLAMFEGLKESMDLTRDQERRIDDLSAGMRTKMQVQAPGGDHESMRESFRQFRQNLNSKLRAILTPEQREKFDEMMANRTPGRELSRPATVYMLEDDQPVLVSVRVGLADERATEVVGGLKEGDAIIVRVTRKQG